MKNRFQLLEDIEDGDRNISKEVESKWHRFKTSYQTAAEEILGYRPKHCKPSISGESWQRIDERKELKQKINNTKPERIKKKLSDEYTTKYRYIKKQLCNDKRNWMDGLIREAEDDSNRGQMRTLFIINKTICNTTSKSSSAVRKK